MGSRSVATEAKRDPKRKVRVAHFGITGPDFTRLARDFMLSDCPARAYRLVTAGLKGPAGMSMATEDVAAVLEGTKRLAGDSDTGLTLELDPDSAEYQKQLRYIYAGRVRIAGAWFRPHIEVVGAGSPSLQRAFGRANADHQIGATQEEIDAGIERAQDALRIFARAIVAQFATEGERVVPVQRGGRKAGGYLIFEPVAEPPMWRTELRDPDEALADFLAAGRTLRRERFEGRSEETYEHVAKAFIDGKIEERDVTYALDTVIDDAEDKVCREESRIALEAARDAREAALEAAWNAKRAEVVAKIHAAVGDDCFDLKIPAVEESGFHSAQPERVVRVPRAPFEQWALRRTSLAHLAAPWTPISPSGWKLPLDDPFHTDWMLGAGLSLEQSYVGPVHDAACKASFELQERLGDFECMVIGGDHDVTGTVGVDVAVLRNLHPDQVDIVCRSRAVLTEEGGAAAHLAQVAVERGIPMLRVPNAVRLFPPGTLVSIHPAEGRVWIPLRHK